MNSYEAIEIAAANAGLSTNKVSRAIGKADSYISASKTRGSTPQANNLAAMLEVCGYKLAAIPSDDLPDTALVIDPPSKEKQ